MPQFELHNAGNTEAQQKEAVAYFLAQSSTGKAATGVLSGLVVSQTTTASGSVQVAAGAGVAQAAVLDGASVLVNDSAATLDVFTANPMGATPRHDVVVFDAATISLRVIVGTPSATPADPTVPSSAIPLARLSHAASATTITTSAITDLRAFTRLAGVSSASASGTATLAAAAAGVTVSAAVTFPAGRFSSAPQVVVQNPANFGSNPLQIWVSALTATGCNINANRPGAAWGPADVSWVAVQSF